MKKNFITVTLVIVSLLLMMEVAQAQEKQISSYGKLGCTNRDYYEKLQMYAAQKEW